MATVSLSVSPREGTGKSVTRKLRAVGNFPAVLYGHDEDALNLTVNAVDFRACIGTRAGTRAVFNLDLAGEKKIAILKEIQRHPLSQEFLHADLQIIRMDEPIEVTVPLHAEGVSPGVKLEGGILEWARRDIDIRVLPGAIPEHIVVDISNLHVNDNIHVSDLAKEGGIEILEDPERTICSVHSARLTVEDVADEESAAAADAEGEEPEAEGDKAE